jgi:hypothetical protein
MDGRRIVQVGQQSIARTNTRAHEVDIAATRSVARNRRYIRTDDLRDAVRSLDTATDPAMMQAMIDLINEEFEERQVGRVIGLFSRCNLGAPYVDHRLDVAGSMIIEHYTRDDAPPPPFAPARPMARNDAYLYVEVYDDGVIVPIRPDGRPVL